LPSNEALVQVQTLFTPRFPWQLLQYPRVLFLKHANKHPNFNIVVNVLCGSYQAGRPHPYLKIVRNMIQCHYMKGIPLQLTTIYTPCTYVYTYRLTACNELINNMHKWKHDYMLLSQKILLKTVMYIYQSTCSKNWVNWLLSAL